MSYLDENSVGQTALRWFEPLGFDTRKGVDISPGAEMPLREAIRKINTHLSEDALAQVVRTVQHPPHPTLIENNRLAGVESGDVESVLADVPPDRMSAICREFTLRLLNENRTRLLREDIS